MIIIIIFLQVFIILCLNALSGTHKCGFPLFVLVQKAESGIKTLSRSLSLNLSVGSFSQSHHSLGHLGFRAPKIYSLSV